MDGVRKERRGFASMSVDKQREIASKGGRAAHATQRQFVYAHVWRLHDLVMWDNRVTMHRARRYGHTEVRDMRRTTLTNEVSSLEQAP